LYPQGEDVPAVGCGGGYVQLEEDGGAPGPD